ncbi:Uncharacterised protein [uncultured archaeon]|nr:Uncharacterised protein [uncultured archaeon]
MAYLNPERKFNLMLYILLLIFVGMSEYHGIKVVKKEGIANTFEVTLSDLSPLVIASNYKGAHIEDVVLNAILTAQVKAHDHVMNTL